MCDKPCRKKCRSNCSNCFNCRHRSDHGGSGFNPESISSSPVPSIIMNISDQITPENWFQDNMFFLHFNNLQVQGIRITIWESDGRVIYDNFNGRNMFEIGINYYTGPLNNNNHNTRLEAILSFQLGKGSAIRNSSTLVGCRFFYHAFPVQVDGVVRVCRIAQLIPNV